MGLASRRLWYWKDEFGRWRRRANHIAITFNCATIIYASVKALKSFPGSVGGSHRGPPSSPLGYHAPAEFVPPAQ